MELKKHKNTGIWTASVKEITLPEMEQFMITSYQKLIRGKADIMKFDFRHTLEPDVGNCHLTFETGEQRIKIMNKHLIYGYCLYLFIYRIEDEEWQQEYGTHVATLLPDSFWYDPMTARLKHYL